jgi:hypothetical protein
MQGYEQGLKQLRVMFSRRAQRADQGRRRARVSIPAHLVLSPAAASSMLL